MINNLDHKSNLVTTLAMVIGGLSITDKITFVLGVVVLCMAGISNYYSFKKNKKAFENEQIQQKKLTNEK